MVYPIEAAVQSAPSKAAANDGPDRRDDAPARFWAYHESIPGPLTPGQMFGILRQVSDRRNDHRGGVLL